MLQSISNALNPARRQFRGSSQGNGVGAACECVRCRDTSSGSQRHFVAFHRFQRNTSAMSRSLQENSRARFHDHRVRGGCSSCTPHNDGALPPPGCHSTERQPCSPARPPFYMQSSRSGRDDRAGVLFSAMLCRKASRWIKMRHTCASCMPEHLCLKPYNSCEADVS